MLLMQAYLHSTTYTFSDHEPGYWGGGGAGRGGGEVRGSTGTLVGPREKNMASKWGVAAEKDAHQQDEQMRKGSITQNKVHMQYITVSKSLSGFENIPFQVILTVTEALNSGK